MQVVGFCILKPKFAVNNQRHIGYASEKERTPKRKKQTASP